MKTETKTAQDFEIVRSKLQLCPDYIDSEMKALDRIEQVNERLLAALEGIVLSYDERGGEPRAEIVDIARAAIHKARHGKEIEETAGHLYFQTDSARCRGLAKDALSALDRLEEERKKLVEALEKINAIGKQATVAWGMRSLVEMHTEAESALEALAQSQPEEEAKPFPNESGFK
jgi:hypothetical protein